MPSSSSPGRAVQGPAGPGRMHAAAAWWLLAQRLARFGLPDRRRAFLLFPFAGLCRFLPGGLSSQPSKLARLPLGDYTLQCKRQSRGLEFVFFFLLLLESHIIQSNFLKLVSRSRISFGYDTP